MRHISLLPEMATQMGDSLTVEEKFVLRFEVVVELMWIARIAIPDSLCNASVAAGAFGDVNRPTGKPSLSDESTESNITTD